MNDSVWQHLYARAKAVLNPRTVSPFIEAAGVASAILTRAGRVYVGVCIDSACSLGMCAERSAIAQMITDGESRIDKLVAVMWDGSVVSPCGACRELLMQLDRGSPEIEVLVSLAPLQTVRLAEWVPDWWGADRFRDDNA